jgi:hypothetical protein
MVTLVDSTVEFSSETVVFAPGNQIEIKVALYLG